MSFTRFPKITERHTIARSRLFALESMQLTFANGEAREYERVARVQQGGGGVLVVPVLNDETILLVREYCAGVDRYEIGFPKGRREPGEDVLQTANRELREEVGYAAGQLKHLTTLSLAPGYFEHTTDIVLARDLALSPLEGDEPEPLDIVSCHLDNFHQLIATGECTEARSIAAFYMTQEILKNGQK